MHPPSMPIESKPTPKPPSVHGLKFNRFMKYEKKAFRPTCPGPSPGVGHEDPPGSCKPNSSGVSHVKKAVLLSLRFSK
ncbi:copper amine oxidase family protein [Tanacetum coccineum]